MSSIARQAARVSQRITTSPHHIVMLPSLGLRPIARSLRRTPEFVLPLVGLLALGIAIASVAFDTIHTRLLQSLPYPTADRIVSLREVGPDGKPRPVALANMTDWRRRLPPFDGMAAYRVQSMQAAPIVGPRGATSDGRIVQVGMVTSDFFHVLGLPPSRGRAFTEAEVERNDPLVLVSQTLAQALRAAGRDSLGAGLTLNDRAYTVIGELPDALFAIQGRTPDVFIPLDPARYGQSRELRTIEAIARLRPDATQEDAARALSSVAAGLALDHPATNRGFGATLVSLDEYLRGNQRQPLRLLALGAALVFGIIALNATNLLLVRAVSRRRETAVKLALGAARARIWRDGLVEALLLAAAALLAGQAGAGLLTVLVDELIPPLLQQALLPASSGVMHATLARLAFAIVICLGLAVVLAAPTFAIARRVTLTPQQTNRRGLGTVRTLHLMVGAQLAVTMILLLSAGLLMRSFSNVLLVPPGFSPDGVMRFGIGLPEARYSTDDQLTGAHDRLIAELLARPEVAQAGTVFRLPLSGAPVLGAFQLETMPLPKSERPVAAMNVASRGYFSALEIPLLDGRTFSPDDGLHRPRVIIVNEALARRFFPKGDAVGQRLALAWASDSHPSGSLWHIVGVVRDTPQTTLDREPLPEIFLSTSQFPLDGGSIVLRARPGRALQEAMVQAAVTRVDPALERIRLAPLDSVLDASLETRRRTLMVASAFALLALVVSGVGLYGTVAFAAVRRRAEFAVRLSLGAQRRQIAGLVIRTAITIVGLAVLPGLLAFSLVGQLLASQFYGVQWLDAPTWLAVSLTALLIALAAALPSAIRAARVPLASLLRAE